MSLSPPKRILVVCTRRIGDVLLVTPLIRSLRRAWPLARIDVLVFLGTAGVLEGNPDIDRVIVFPERSRWRQRLVELRNLWRHYDLALSTLPSDRARIYGWAAGRRHLGLIDPLEPATKRWWLDQWVAFDDLDTHTVTMGLALADRLGIERCAEVVVPRSAQPESRPATPYAVCHPHPKFNYKMWHEAGWIALIQALRARGLQVFLTGAPGEAECCARIAEATGASSLGGKQTLAQIGDLLRGASLFIGPDTVVTHMAAATGVPTVALFGPSNPVKWGAWPAAWQGPESPWQLRGSGRRGNVFLVQGGGDCVPCRLEGCDRHVASYSRCLQEMPAERVIACAIEMLEGAGS